MSRHSNLTTTTYESVNLLAKQSVESAGALIYCINKETKYSFSHSFMYLHGTK